MTSARDLDAESRSQLECVGEMVRVYTNAKTGDSVTLQLILGPAGPTAVHTPEICMAQRDFTPLGDRRAVAVGQTTIGSGSDDSDRKIFTVNR